MILPFPNTDRGITQAAVDVDMLRRVCNFVKAAKLIETLLTYSQAQGVIKQVLQFQRKLCNDEDPKCYSISDAAGQ